MPTRKQPIYGTKSRSYGSIAGRPTTRVFSIFIAGIDPNLSSSGLSKYIQEVLQVNPINIETNKQNENNQSFKVTVNNQGKSICFNPNMWDENIIIKPFKTRRQLRQLRILNICTKVSKLTHLM